MTLRPDPDRPLPTVRTAMQAGCLVNVVCRDCQNISRLDLARLSDDGRGDVPLIELPLVCRCGARLSWIIVSDEEGLISGSAVSPK